VAVFAGLDVHRAQITFDAAALLVCPFKVAAGREDRTPPAISSSGGAQDLCLLGVELGLREDPAVEQALELAELSVRIARRLSRGGLLRTGRLLRRSLRSRCLLFLRLLVLVVLVRGVRATCNSGYAAATLSSISSTRHDSASLLLG
jgi:hypothetical protein